MIVDRRSLPVVLLLTWAVYARSGRTQDPPPQIPIKVSTFTKLEVTHDRLEGELVDVWLPGTFPANLELTWTIDGLAPTERTLRPEGPAAVGVANAGHHVVIVTGQSAVMDAGAVQLTLVNATVDIGVAPPEPEKPLSELVDKPTAALLTDMYTKMMVPGVLEDIDPPTPAMFWIAHDGALRAYHVKGHAAEETIKTQYLAPAVTDPLNPAALRTAMARIVKDLGATPTPPPLPPVVEGRRIVAILRETEDSTPEIGRLVTDLRVGPSADYLKAKGHTLDILDDDNPAPEVRKLVALGVLEPALFICDAATQAVLYSGPLPPTANEVLAVLKANGG